MQRADKEGRCIAGDDGSYGTSIERYKALDPASDIILAFKQNDRLLTPDHGYPLRIIIPGIVSSAIGALMTSKMRKSLAVQQRHCGIATALQSVSDLRQLLTVSR